VNNGNHFSAYYFKECSADEGKKCFLGVHRNGTLVPGNMARKSQDRTQWLTLFVSPEDQNYAYKRKMEYMSNPWTPSTTPAPTTHKPKDRREQRRKRVRRWCRNLSVILRRSEKFLQRCKHDCNVLQDMLEHPQRSLRRCLVSYVRRRERKRKLKERGGRRRKVSVNMDKVKKEVQKLMPHHEQIFQWQRDVRRCNRRRQKLNKPRCTSRDVRRMIRRRKKKRVEEKSKNNSDTLPTSPSPTTTSTTTASSTSRPHRVRHQRHRAAHGGSHVGSQGSKTVQDDPALSATVVRQRRQVGAEVRESVRAHRLSDSKDVSVSRTQRDVIPHQNTESKSLTSR
jgi:hypothetical protein